MSGGNDVGGGPCGACKFLRRKCLKGCIFAPYFDSDQGTAHFAAVHKVFGASNASKMLSRIPAHKRLDAVVTICYEALARVRDPVYGCVGHIFTLQQQVVKLQAELAYVQARLSTFQRLPLLPQAISFQSACCEMELTSSKVSSSALFHLDHSSQSASAAEQAFLEMTSSSSPMDQELIEDNGCELQALAQEFVSGCLPRATSFRPPSNSQ